LLDVGGHVLDDEAHGDFSLETCVMYRRTSLALKRFKV